MVGKSIVGESVAMLSKFLAVVGKFPIIGGNLLAMAGVLRNRTPKRKVFVGSAVFLFTIRFILLRASTFIEKKYAIERKTTIKSMDIGGGGGRYEYNDCGTRGD
jgi:hypothetical protein